MSEREPHDHYTIPELEQVTSFSAPIKNDEITNNYIEVDETELKPNVETLLKPESRTHNLPDSSIFRQYPKPREFIQGIDPSLQRDSIWRKR